MAVADVRTLLHIPIIHTRRDMGALGSAIQRLSIEKLGQREWERNVEAIERLWTGIGEAIEAWDLPYARVRLYQDGLPNCGSEAQIVTDLANSGSLNHQLLLHLMGKGATLIGTEAPGLLLEEYQLIRQVLDARNLGEVEQVEMRQEALSDSLLERRDRHIAQRINETLLEAETGIAFLGMLHCLEGLLDDDIRVCYPILQPVRRERRRT